MSCRADLQLLVTFGVGTAEATPLRLNMQQSYSIWPHHHTHIWAELSAHAPPDDPSLLPPGRNLSCVACWDKGLPPFFSFVLAHFTCGLSRPHRGPLSASASKKTRGHFWTWRLKNRYIQYILQIAILNHCTLLSTTFTGNLRIYF